MSERYRVVEGSQSYHCCFGYTVVDMTKPVMIGDKHYNDQYEAMCETFDKADADRICQALNNLKENDDDSHHHQ